MTKRLPKTADYYDISFTGKPDYCEKTELLAYVSSRAVQGEYRYEQKVLLKNISTGEERRVTAGGTRETNPRFSPDGSRLCFLSDADGEMQIYIAELTTGECRRLTAMRYGAADPVWSPKGDRIAFLSKCAVGEDKTLLQQPLTSEERLRLARERLKEPVEITDFAYKTEEAMGFAAKETTHIWSIGLDEAQATMLTDGDRDHVMPVWFPDGERILFTSNRARPRSEFIGMDLFSVPAKGGEISRLTDSLYIAYYPKAFVPRFTPDGKTVIVGALTPLTEGGMPPTRLYKLPAEGGEAVSIWPDNAPCHEATCFFYNGEAYGGYYESAQVSSDGEYVYFISGWHGSGNIYRARINGEPEITALTSHEAVYKSIGMPQNGRMVVLRGDFLHYSEAYLFDERDGSETQLTDGNPWLSEVAFSKPEEIWMDTLDGESRLQGWVFKPQSVKEGEKYPAIVYIHGGPTPFYGYGLTYEHQCILGAGIGLMFCNFRGSTGYGPKHADVKKAYDGAAFYDILQFVDEACRRFDWIDSERLGVTGGSFGGYMTNWIAGHSKRFKAAVSQRSVVSDLIMDVSSDMSAGGSQGFRDYYDYMRDRIRTSPVSYAENIDIPFLILHSYGDMRCPVEGAHQLFVAIKDWHPDLPVRMVLFPRSNHELVTGGGIMELRVRHYDEMINWFKKYL